MPLTICRGVNIDNRQQVLLKVNIGRTRIIRVESIILLIICTTVKIDNIIDKL